MVKHETPCHSATTTRNKRLPYEEYYYGERDSEDRKNGQGENHWTGAESLEWYIGPMLRDTMHGDGDYRWRYKGPDGECVTYEGRFFANRMHGYGVMSYPEGRVFTGLYYNDVRWGPGVERTIDLRASIGLWRGSQLARLIWRPNGPVVAPDLTTGPMGPSFLNPYRIVLAKKTKIIGETNSALKLLKHYGADPIRANEIWTKLYPKYCTDTDSVLCYKNLFDHHYYKGKIETLEQAVDGNLESDSPHEDDIANDEEEDKSTSFYVWNNNPPMVHMMKHCYQHERQRAPTRLMLDKLLNGPRRQFRPPAKHETDCRSLLIASYAGIISTVAQLVNEEDVYPDIADNQGNTALMYAACGDQLDVIHFLVEAGASVDAYNDSCCTPLGMALIRYLCVARDVHPKSMCQVLLPPKPEKGEVPQNDGNIIEWHINRDHSGQEAVIAADTKGIKSQVSAKKLKTVSPKAQGSIIMNTKHIQTSLQEQNYDSDDDTFSNEKKVFIKTQGEYNSKIISQFALKAAATVNTYLFTVNNMANEVQEAEEDMLKTLVEKTSVVPKKVISKVKPPKAPSKITVNQLPRDSILSYEKDKIEILAKIELTILQLLKDGADPKLVKCPKPAMLLVTKAGSSDLVKHVASCGTNVDEKIPELMDYTALDIIISEPFTEENLCTIDTLLEVGADTRHRLKSEQDPASIPEPTDVPIPDDGPTLLHAVIAKKADTELEEQIRRSVISSLLKYNADPTAQFHGRSPIDFAMMKKLDALETFIKCPATNLNAIINDRNHTILMKVFSRDYFKTTLGINKLPTLTNLLLFGADPLIRSFDGDTMYENVFEFAQKNLNELCPLPTTMALANQGKGKSQTKMKSKQNLEDHKKGAKAPAEATEYKEALNMMRECTRLLHIRWLQARLLNELIDVIIRFKHRDWTMIIKEHKNGHNVGLWVTTARCLEIWDIMKTTHKRKYSDGNVLRKLLSIVQFYNKRLKAQRDVSAAISAVEKNIIESDVRLLTKEHKMASSLTQEAAVWKRDYVKPELDYKALKKHQLCFECGLRTREDNIPCEFCELVSFCDLNCLNSNVERNSGHPCSELLAEKYSPPFEDFQII